MKLYLSSVGIPDKDTFRSLLPKNTAKVGVIANAWDVYPNAKSEPFIQGRLDDFKNMGCAAELLDLRNIKDIASTLGEFDSVWVTGGNSFYLNWLLHQSGFSDAIRPLIETSLVYGGESAGAVVAGSTLHGIEHMDDPKASPKIIWDGLGLVDFGMVPHWGNPKYAEILQSCHEEMTAHVQTVKTITDGGYILTER